jgi:delta14-sterol reductase
VRAALTAQARLLVDRDPGLGMVGLVLIGCLNMMGYAIFRGANSQKDAFRRNPLAPEVAHLQYIETARGTRLLTTGWWGMARKINYTCERRARREAHAAKRTPRSARREAHA